jgi:hypothetical protein
MRSKVERASPILRRLEFSRSSWNAVNHVLPLVMQGPLSSTSLVSLDEVMMLHVIVDRADPPHPGHACAAQRCHPVELSCRS